MKTVWLTVPPIIFTVALALLLFVPIVDSGTGYTACNPSGCIQAHQYESIAYHYGGWGAYYQTGTNYYTVESWMCSCPSNATICCVAPYGAQIAAAATALLGFDIGSIALLFTRRRNQEPVNAATALEPTHTLDH